MVTIGNKYCLNEKAGGILLMLLFLTSCSEKNLYQRIDREMCNAPGDTTIVNMAELFPIQWDTMFVFRPFLYNRPKYQVDQDIARRIIFVQNGKTVYQEDEVAVSEPYSVEFNMDDYSFTPETAVFYAVKVTKDTKKKHIALTKIHTDTHKSK